MTPNDRSQDDADRQSDIVELTNPEAALPAPDPRPDTDTERQPNGISLVPCVVPVKPDDVHVVLLPNPERVLIAMPVDWDEAVAQPLVCDSSQSTLQQLRSLGERIQFFLPPRSEPPGPGKGWWLLWALVLVGWTVFWCVAFFVMQVVVLVAVAFVTIVVQAVRADDWQAYLNSLGAQSPAAAVAADSESKPAEPEPKQAQTSSAKLSPALLEVMTPAIFAIQLFLVLFGWLVVRLGLGKDWARRLALRRPSVTQLFVALLGLPGLMLVATAVHALSREVLPGGSYQKDMEGLFEGWPLWFGVLVIGVGAGLGEELWFRGFFGRGLVGRFGFLIGVLLTSLFFGLMHVDPPHVVATAVMGVALHYTYLTTRSLWVPMLLHTVNNSLGVLAMQFDDFKKADPAPNQVPMTLYIAAIALLAAVGWALFRSRPRLVAEDGGDQAPWAPDHRGVEHPPSGSGTVVYRPWPGWLAAGLVVVAVSGFVAAAYPMVAKEGATRDSVSTVGGLKAMVRLAQPF